MFGSYRLVLSILHGNSAETYEGTDLDQKLKTLANMVISFHAQTGNQQSRMRLISLIHKQILKTLKHERGNDGAIQVRDVDSMSDRINHHATQDIEFCWHFQIFTCCKRGHYISISLHTTYEESTNLLALKVMR